MTAWTEIEDFVYRQTGLTFPESRRLLLVRGVEKAMKGRGVTDPAALLRLMERNPPLLDEVVGLVTVAETYFFRHIEQLEEIQRTILPALLKCTPGRSVRIWSAGCATGEEPYSLAIMAREAGLADRVRIVATDISREALSDAQRGEYRSWSFRATPRHIKSRYFDSSSGESFVVRPEVRAMVEFQYLNLVRDTYPALSTGVWGVDVAICRNVLIYFDACAARTVTKRILASLRPGGWLVLGASDPPLPETEGVRVVSTDAGLLYQREVGTRPSSPSAPPLPPLTATDAVPEAPRPSATSLPERPTVSAESTGSSTPPSSTPLPLAREPESVAPGRLAREAYSKGEYEEAARQADVAVGDGVGEADLWALLVRSLANLGRAPEATRQLAEATRRFPLDPELAYLESVLLAEEGHFREAVRAARRAIYQDRTYVMGYMAIGASLSRLGEQEAARRAYANAASLLATRPSDAVVPGADGEPAGRLLVLARTQHKLLEEPCR